eukprot:7847206-Pyramimonas_sp.AAC.1
MVAAQCAGAMFPVAAARRADAWTTPGQETVAGQRVDVVVPTGAALLAVVGPAGSSGPLPPLVVGLGDILLAAAA